MRLYLIRHAIAEERVPGGEGDDFDRALTPEGMRKMRRHVKALVKLGAIPGEIWSSPLVRARQTAEILAAGLGGSAKVRLVDALRPDQSPGDVLPQLGRSAHDSVALVGHEPLLGELAARLLSGRRTDVVEFKKGGAACFEVEEPKPPIHGRLLWLLTPKAMAEMA